MNPISITKPSPINQAAIRLMSELQARIAWLDRAFPVSEITIERGDNRSQRIPVAKTETSTEEDYQDLRPNDELANFAWLHPCDDIGDETDVRFKSTITFFLDMRKVYPDKYERKYHHFMELANKAFIAAHEATGMGIFIQPSPPSTELAKAYPNIYIEEHWLERLKYPFAFWSMPVEVMMPRSCENQWNA